jgi:hypothetical protein
LAVISVPNNPGLLHAMQSIIVPLGKRDLLSRSHEHTTQQLELNSQGIDLPNLPKFAQSLLHDAQFLPIKQNKARFLPFLKWIK